MYNKQELIKELNGGKEFSYIYFWGHRQKERNIFDKSCFSQWFPIGFTLDKQYYPTTEHFMMAKKAKLFNDETTYINIVKSKTPKEAKAYGRQVKNFDNDIWEENAFNIVVQGNFEKFSQNEQIKKILIDTYPHILVEASPVDKVWGIGLSSDDKKASNPLEWEGENYLGFALMKVRETLIKPSLTS